MSTKPKRQHTLLPVTVGIIFFVLIYTILAATSRQEAPSTPTFLRALATNARFDHSLDVSIVQAEQDLSGYLILQLEIASSNASVQDIKYLFDDWLLQPNDVFMIVTAAEGDLAKPRSSLYSPLAEIVRKQNSVWARLTSSRAHITPPPPPTPFVIRTHGEQTVYCVRMCFRLLDKSICSTSVRVNPELKRKAYRTTTGALWNIMSMSDADVNIGVIPPS